MSGTCSRLALRSAVSLGFATLLALGAPASAPAGITGQSWIVHSEGTLSSDSYIDVGDRYIVYEHFNGFDYDIVVRDRKTGAYVSTVSHGRNERFPTTWGGRMWCAADDPPFGPSYSLFAWTPTSSAFWGLERYRTPSMSGPTVVYAQDEDGNGDWDITAAVPGRPGVVMGGPGDDYNPEAWRNIVTWQKYSAATGHDIFCESIGSGIAYFHLKPGRQSDPVVWGRWLAWIEGTGDTDIRVRNLITGEEGEFGMVGAAEAAISIWGDRMLYGVDDGATLRMYAWEMMGSENAHLLWQAPKNGRNLAMNSSQDGDTAAWFVYKQTWPEPDVFDDGDVYAVRISDTVDIERLQGANRYLTAVQISRKAFPSWRKPQHVVLATGETFPDALGGAGFGTRGPILLTPKNTLPSDVAAELRRLDPPVVHILGSSGAVSDRVFDAVKDALPGAWVTRVEGPDRYGTARAIMKQVTGQGAGKTAFVATGANFPDALAASPIAAAKGWPILLAEPRGISSTTVQTMKDRGVEEVYILGGSNVVNDVTEDRLKAAFGTSKVHRLWGRTRYETARAVAQWAVENVDYIEWTGAAIATGENFPDALSGGVLAGRNGTVMLLSNTSGLTAATRNVLAAHAEEIRRVRLLGGTPALSQAVASGVRSAID